MYFRILKRIFDLIISFLILLIFLPVFVLIYIFSFIFQGYPIYYTSKRMIGINKEIKITKFRTMVKDATNDKYGLEKKYMKDGYLDVPLGSEVYTPFGQFLEKTQLVEVPQVFLVLFNYMSFVGNRPLPLKNVKELKKKFPKKWEQRFNSPAGITGITQVVGKFNLDSKKRLELESLYSEVYMKGNILKADLYIFFSTIILLLLHDSVAYRSYESAKNLLLSCLNK